MKYKIRKVQMSNDSIKYTAHYKYKYWPFWNTFEYWSTRSERDHPILFDTHLEAELRINMDIAQRESRKIPSITKILSEEPYA